MSKPNLNPKNKENFSVTQFVSNLDKTISNNINNTINSTLNAFNFSKNSQLNNYNNKVYNNSESYNERFDNWSDKEQSMFLKGVIKYGQIWSSISKYVNTKSTEDVKLYVYNFIKNVTDKYNLDKFNDDIEKLKKHLEACLDLFDENQYNIYKAILILKDFIPTNVNKSNELNKLLCNNCINNNVNNSYIKLSNNNFDNNFNSIKESDNIKIDNYVIEQQEPLYIDNNIACSNYYKEDFICYEYNNPSTTPFRNLLNDLKEKNKKLSSIIKYFKNSKNK